MNITKLIAIVSLAMTVLTMVTPNQFSIFASPTTEDDGYTYPDDATEDEKEEIDEREQEAWEDAGTSTTESTAADASNCKLDGSADGIQQKFDTAKYQACMLHTKNDKIYYDGFVAGCMNVGNTKLICQTVADSSILNMKT